MRHWISHLLRGNGNALARGVRSPRSMFEALEPRKLLTDIQVTHLENWDLEAAINFANNEPGADVITFSPELSGTISVSARQTLTDTLTIRGNGKVSLSGGDNFTILQVFDGASVTLENLTLTHSSGEAIRVQGSLTVTNCTFVSNRTFIGGGGLYVRPSGSASVTGCTFRNNTASRNNNEGWGGAIRNEGQLTVTGSTFEANYATKDGGAIFNNTGGTLTVNSSAFFGNISDFGDGGAIRNLGVASVNNSTIAGNDAVFAGGLMGDMNVNFCTIAFNTAAYVAGGVLGQGNFIPSNSIIAKNTVNGSPSDIGAGSTNFSAHSFSISGNLIGDAASSDGISSQYNNFIGFDPEFLTSTPVDNGGPTKTLAIGPASPAKDRLSYTGSLSTDQRGLTRFGQGIGVDIGAFERQFTGAGLNVDTAADENDGDYSQGDLSLREALNLAAQYEDGLNIYLNQLPSGSVISLTGGPLAIQSGTSIYCDDARRVTIDGLGQTSVLSVNGGSHTLAGFTIANAGDVGGITGAATLLTLVNMALTGNRTSSLGGAVSFANGTLDIQGSTFEGNSAAVAGGAVFVNGATLRISNSTFSGNQASYGAAITGQASSISISSSTIAYNTATNGPGAGAISASSLLLTSTIVAQNTNGDLDSHADPASSRNLIGDASTAGGLTNGQNGNIVGADARLAPLAFSGGTTKTHALLGGSPAFGAGSNTLSLPFDQRGEGYFRVRYDTADIGAFEAVRPTISSFTSSTLTITAGQPATVTASGVADGDGSIASVEFYRDSNANGLPDPGEFFGADNNPAGNYTMEFDPAGLPGGALTLIALAYDNHGNTGMKTLPVTITQPLPHTYTVSTTDDADDYNYADGQLSLREAVRLANENAGFADTIIFAPGLNGQTITLAGDELSIDDSLTITGPGRTLLSIDANSASRIFSISPSINVSISGLSLVRGFSGDDGGAVNNSGNLTLQDVLVGSSFAGHMGGGVSNDGSLTVTRSTFADNGATFMGGAIGSSGSLTVNDCTIDSNAASDGAGIAAILGTVTINRSLLVSNATTDTGHSIGGGGAIVLANNVIASVVSSTITDNSTIFALGGGIYNQSGTLHVSNSTISGNRQTGSFGGGIFTEQSATTILESTIVAGNEGGDLNGPVSPSSNHNLVQDASGAQGISNGVNGNLLGVAPLLGALADNGGPTRTMALLPGSPAISAGSNTGNLTYDQRGQGFSRTRGAATDIGAFEFGSDPVIGSVTLSSLQIRAGQPLTITANSVAAGESGLTIARVEFYKVVTTRSGTTSTKVGEDSAPADGWTYVLSTAGMAPGSPHLIGPGGYDGLVDYVALAVDSQGSSSTQVFAANFDQLVLLQGYPLLGASAGNSGNINVTMGSALDNPVIYQQQAGSSTWTKSDLQAKTGSPAITGELVSWVDRKDGRNYAAAMSASGLILFTNTSGNAWSFRNLTAEVPGFPAITGNLTTFTSIDNKVSLAGVAANGDLIRYSQTGAGPSGQYAWTAVNHGDDLRAQNLSVPQFAGRITSFVTPWNALNVVGLDAQGNIQAVWWHQSLATAGKWTTNNLSQEYGAPPLTGGLTVWLTSWSAINIAGTDSTGRLSATWWVPGVNNNRWNNNNLTDDINGPLLQADSMCSWVTPWGAMNIAGRESDGTISVYWWVPNHNNNQWQVEHFRDSLPTASRTVGPVSGVTALTGDKGMSILSTTSNGSVVRLWWNPTNNVWSEQNISQVAVPA